MNLRRPWLATAHRTYPTGHCHQHSSTYGHLWLYRRYRPYITGLKRLNATWIWRVQGDRSSLATYLLPSKIRSTCKLLGELCSVSTTSKIYSSDPSPWRSWSACRNGLSCWITPRGSTNRPLKEIYHHEDNYPFWCSELWWYRGTSSFLGPGSCTDCVVCDGLVCILLFFTHFIHFLHSNFWAVLSEVTGTIPSRLVSLGLSDTTDYLF